MLADINKPTWQEGLVLGVETPMIIVAVLSPLAKQFDMCQAARIRELWKPKLNV